MSINKLTQAQKNKLRRKAVEALKDEKYGDDGDGFHEHATAQAVISLLDELTLKTEQRANWCAMAKKLGEDLDSAEKRIAELEAREVKIKQFDEFAICHFGASEDYAKGYIDCQKNYNKALGAANILVSLEG